jgi:hypothetical protein
MLRGNHDCKPVVSTSAIIEYTSDRAGFFPFFSNAVIQADSREMTQHLWSVLLRLTSGPTREFSLWYVQRCRCCLPRSNPEI